VFKTISTLLRENLTIVSRMRIMNTPYRLFPKSWFWKKPPNDMYDGSVQDPDRWNRASRFSLRAIPLNPNMEASIFWAPLKLSALKKTQLTTTARKVMSQEIPRPK
jgi:hypothetical protein